MKREDLIEVLPDADKEAIDTLFKMFGKELNPLKASEKEATKKADDFAEQLEAANAKIASLNATLDDANKKIEAGMTAEELLAKQKEDAAERELEFIRKSNALDAKSLFVEAGCFTDDEIAALVEQVVCEDLETTTNKAKAIIDVVNRRSETVKQEVTDDLLKGNPKPGGSGGGSPKPMSKSDFLKLPYKDQLQLKAENPNIMSELSKE